MDLFADNDLAQILHQYVQHPRMVSELLRIHAQAPGLIAPVTSAVDPGPADLGFLRLDPAAWAEAADVSIDYAVMEKSDNLSVVPFSAG